jgi:hypothetical protein
MKIRDLYAERDAVRRHLPRYTHAQIAKMMDCSPSTVARVVNREGAYAFVGGDSLGEVKASPRQDADMTAAAAASLARLNKLIAESPPVEEPEAADPDEALILAKAEAIRQQLTAPAQPLGNSDTKLLSNTHTSGNSARRETEAQDGKETTGPNGAPDDDQQESR